MQFEQKLLDYINLATDKRKEFIDEICRDSEISKVFKIIRKAYSDSVMYVLIDLAKKMRGNLKIYKDDIVLLLHNNNPKVRIKALRLIKLIDPALFADDLTEAFEKEETMYTYSDYIRAIAAAKNKKAENFLNSYNPRSTEEKHLREEKEALDKAKAAFIKRVKAQPKIQPRDKVLITAPNLNVARGEFSKFGVPAEIEDKYLALRELLNYNSLFKVRAFNNAYIDLGMCSVEKIPDFIKEHETEISERMGVKNYRLEIRGVSHKERLKLISDTVFKNKLLINAPSAYSFELLADASGKTARILLNPLTDERFSYRKESVPASITGANAASVCAFASEYFNENAKVLDNCCGSGTMLFERGFYPHRSLTGIDINTKTIAAAKTNGKFAESGRNLYIWTH